MVRETLELERSEVIPRFFYCLKHQKKTGATSLFVIAAKVNVQARVRRFVPQAVLVYSYYALTIYRLSTVCTQSGALYLQFACRKSVAFIPRVVCHLSV